MSDFAKWVKRWSARVPLSKDGTGLRLSGQQLDDLVDLTAQQHEALLDFGDWEKNCGDQNCKSCRAMKAAEAFKEKWE